MNNLGQNPVLSFAYAMQKQISKNDHKGGWSKCGMGYLLCRIFEELEEVQNAIKDNKPEGNILRECADVANFAMMIADNYEQGEIK